MANRAKGGRGVEFVAACALAVREWFSKCVFLSCQCVLSSFFSSVCLFVDLFNSFFPTLTPTPTTLTFTQKHWVPITCQLFLAGALGVNICRIFTYLFITLVRLPRLFTSRLCFDDKEMLEDHISINSCFLDASKVESIDLFLVRLFISKHTKNGTYRTSFVLFFL